MADGTASGRGATEAVRGSLRDHFPIAIIGAGLSGIGLAIQLRAAGVEDFTILERADAVGGTWRDNTYPGCACDVASNLYSYSFAPNPEWRRVYGQQAEILDYVKGVARARGIEAFIRFGHELREARWDERRHRWTLSTSRGTFAADVLVTAVGAFGDPVIPTLPGLERFAGTSFHTARWDHRHDLEGRKVAVIGTGASAVQVVPAIVARVGKLSVFQRTPIWVLPRMDGETTPLTRALLRRVPLLQRALRAGWYCTYECLVGLPQFVDTRFLRVFETIGRLQLRRQVADPELRRRLTPHYRFGCKRPAISDDFYPALSRPNVELVTAGIREVRERGIVTEDGVEHPVDTLIFATGFQVPHQIGERIVGRQGRRLSDAFGAEPAAYLGTTVSGYPNLFMLAGPFSGPGSQSYVYMVEAQMRYVTDAVRTMRRKRLSTVEPREDVLASFRHEMERRSRHTSWVGGTCRSYYQNAAGGNAGLWPHWSFLFRWRTRRFDLGAFTTSRDTTRASA